MAKTTITIPGTRTIPAQNVTIPSQTIQLSIPSQTVELSAETIPPYIFEVDAAESAASTGFYKPSSQADFQTALQAAIDNQQTLFLDPTTVLTISGEMTFTLPGSDGDNTKRPGLWAYGSRFVWQSDGVGTAGMMTFTTSGEDAYFYLAGLSGYGAGYDHTPAHHFVKLIAHSGRALRDFRVVDLTCKHFYNGLWLEGEVFEGFIDNFSSEWCRDAGIHLEHTPPDVLSNIFINRPSIIRAPQNLGPGKGVYCVGSANSVMVNDGNFISLAGPAIHGESGVKKIRGCSFENCGTVDGAAIQIDTVSFVTLISGCDGSNTGGHMPYLIRCPQQDPAKFTQANNYIYSGTVMEP